MERLFLGKVYEKIGKVPSVLITFILVMVGWAIFRIENIGDCWTFITRLFSFDFAKVSIHDAQLVTTLVAALAFSFVGLFGFGKKMQKFVFTTEYSTWQHVVVWIVAMFMLLMSIAALNVSSFSPFIYFRF
jgi:alginate O-acetyltransferase complex protein AlgI